MVLRVERGDGGCLRRGRPRLPLIEGSNEGGALEEARRWVWRVMAGEEAAAQLVQGGRVRGGASPMAAAASVAAAPRESDGGAASGGPMRMTIACWFCS